MGIEQIPPAFAFFALALALPLLPGGRLRALTLLALPLAALWQIWALPEGNLLSLPFFGFELELMRVDRLARAFGMIFALAAFLGNLFAWHLRDRVQQVAALIYAGAAIGAVFAGDLITLFFYWEGTAIASVFLIWARRTEGAYHTGLRYLVIQVGSGVLLLAGAVLLYRQSGAIAFERMQLGSLATWLIFLSFGIKAAFPLLHNWLQDGYPAATVTGTVILSAFTTKLAIYALARGFAGTEILIYIGVIMTIFPVFFAEIENDLRRVLSYSLNNQLGFMVAGIGLGTEAALNGTVSHAIAHILYKALLFMSVGAVLFRTGTAKASELGGLYRTMPLTALFCLIGAASISAFPLFSGFVTKSMVLGEAAKGGYTLVWAGLVFASAAVLSHSGIKIPFFMFFAHDSGRRPAEAPAHMLWAMGIAAALSVAIGIFPGPLYALLPYPVEFAPYTASHVIAQLQLLLFALLAFAWLWRSGLHPPEIRAVNLDFDWTYRRLLPALIGGLAGLLGGLWRRQADFWERRLTAFIAGLYHSQGPEGRLASTWPTGAMVVWIAVLLGATLILNFI